MQHINWSGLPIFCFIAAVAAASHGSAVACAIYSPPRLSDISYADVIVVGSISNYRIIRDEAFRKQMLANPYLSARKRKTYTPPKEGTMSGDASFNIHVERILVGKALSKLSVTWNNSNFKQPDHMPAGRYLIALRRPYSPRPPLLAPNAAFSPRGETDRLYVLQPPCSRAFIYDIKSIEAHIILKLLTAPGG